jgi:aryl-alcohol dehydrogenase-like predicted oxidoreductase
MPTALRGKVELGRTGLRLAALGVGTWPWGDRRIWRTDPAACARDAEAAYHAALAAGIDLFDTAEVYGRGESERLLGRFMKAAEAGAGAAPARRPFIATKFAPLPNRLASSSLPAALDRSLERLGVATIDLYQVHWPWAFIREGALIDRLAGAVESGKVRAVGVSNYGAGQMRRAHAALAAHGVPLASNQVSYHLLDRAPERNGTIAAARELGITIIAYSPLAMGVLTAKYRPGTPGVNLYRRLTRNFLRLGSAMPLVAELEHVALRHGATPAQVALAWLLREPGVIPIPSARNAAQARENAAALDLALGPEDLAALDRVSRAAGAR